MSKSMSAIDAYLALLRRHCVDPETSLKAAREYHSRYVFLQYLHADWLRCVDTNAPLSDVLRETKEALLAVFPPSEEDEPTTRKEEAIDGDNDKAFAEAREGKAKGATTHA